MASADRCARAVLEHHAGPTGYALAVDREGRVRDGSVVVKFQALLTKLAFLPSDPAALAGNAALLSLLRDR